MNEKYRIEILCKNPPQVKSHINYKVGSFEYKGKTIDLLYSNIYENDICIGKGYIMGFYSIFINGRYITKTDLGRAIHSLKYSNITESETDFHIQKITDKICQTIKDILEDAKNDSNTKLTFIPSSKMIPEKISDKLAIKYNIYIHHLISKKDKSKTSKGLCSFAESLMRSFDNYEIDIANIDKNSNYFIVDDVFGYGGSLIAVLSKMYSITGKPNNFICVAKDTKR